jgi:MipA family protein
MPSTLRCRAVALLLWSVLAARAEEPEAPLPGLPTPSAPVWEGALGLTGSYRPEYAGASRQIVKVSPAFFLRYGRFTITNASGFVTRRADDVVRGLGADLVRSDRVRVNLALRFDAGRQESTSVALGGTGDIKATVRVRTAANWKLQGPWRLGASWSVDALGRGGGNYGDISGGWEKRVAPDTTVTLGTSLSMAGDRYMQTYFGISAEQSARTSYPVYQPRSGLRDISVFGNVRHDLGPEWTVLGGASVTQLLGPAAASPLTGHRGNWGINAGFARRF